MSLTFRTVVGSALVGLLSACTTALWHPWIDKQVAGPSASPRQARLVSLRIVKPPPSTPAKIARWCGYWHGWFGYSKEFDMKIVFARIEGDEAIIQYSWATANAQNVSILRGKFSGDEVEMKLPVGGHLSIRLRPNGNEMEIVQRTGRGEIALEFYGLLTTRTGQRVSR
ncbi:hypothetical protein J7E62_00005 [Variovorax paradoxus]|nr:hypothetical protein [Variovorax paradoxus]